MPECSISLQCIPLSLRCRGGSLVPSRRTSPSPSIRPVDWPFLLYQYSSPVVQQFSDIMVTEWITVLSGVDLHPCFIEIINVSSKKWAELCHLEMTATTISVAFAIKVRGDLLVHS